MKALCVVAHSDDHVLWMAGTILRLNQWRWDILSLCKSHNNEDFQPKRITFEEACVKLGATRYDAKALQDYQPKEKADPEQLPTMKNEILNFTDDNNYDLVFTHSMQPACEYSYHANHVEARDAVNQLIDSGSLITKGTLYFCYRSGGCGKPVVADLNNADYKIKLTDQELAAKRSLKHIFTWATGDLRALNLWCNHEPTIEAFEVKPCDLQLPSDFIRISRVDPTR